MKRDGNSPSLPGHPGPIYLLCEFITCSLKKAQTEPEIWLDKRGRVKYQPFISVARCYAGDECKWSHSPTKRKRNEIKWNTTKREASDTCVVAAPKARQLSASQAWLLTEVCVDNDEWWNTAAPEGTNKIVLHLLFHKVSILHCPSISGSVYIESSTWREAEPL